MKNEEENKSVLANASQWRLMWVRFKRHRLALLSAGVLIVFYFLAIICEFVAPYDPNHRNPRAISAPPQRIRFFDAEGNFHFRPFVYGYDMHVDDDTWRRVYTPNPDRAYPIRFFHRGQKCRFWNLFEIDIHLFGVGTGQYFHLAGTDRLGRDMFSRIIYGARVSLTLGLCGVILTFVFGISLGGIAGYIGGWTDAVVQRTIDILRCIPKLPMWMALSAALPPTWSGIKVYFGITVILSFIGWTGLARVVRGKFIAMREEDFVVAARLLGASRRRIIFKHLLPSFLSHIITAATLAVPGMILGETALSFLGIGLRPPTVSWGVLLQQAQNYQVLVMTPWLLFPGLCVVVVVLAFNLMGDGLRDAADPYSTT